MPLAHNHLDILPKSPKISFLLYGSNLRWSHFNQKTCQIWPFSPAGIQIDGTLSSSFSPLLISRLIHTLLVAWSLAIIIASIIESIGSVFVFEERNDQDHYEQLVAMIHFKGSPLVSKVNPTF